VHNEVIFGICGTAGRKQDAERLSRNHFDAMCECVRVLLKQFNEGGYDVTTLAAGGAAFADHSAVTLYLNKEVPKLKLFFPCQFLGVDEGFDTTPSSDNERAKGYSTGDIANRLHARFSRKLGVNSLSELSIAIQQGAEVHVAKGFWARNALVAQSDILLAMTFGDREWVKPGSGTAHCVMTYLNRVKKHGFFDKSFHYNLQDGEIYMGCKAKTDPSSP
jgi:hypothetical protein